VQCQASMTALSSADPGRPIVCFAPSRWQVDRSTPAVYSLPCLIGAEDHARRLLAAHRQCAVG